MMAAGKISKSQSLKKCVRPTCLGLGRGGLHLDVPGAALNAVGDTRVDIANHALGRLGLVLDAESNGVLSELFDLPEAERPVVGAAVKGVTAIVVLGLEGLATNAVLGAANTVHVATGNRIVDGVAGVDGWWLL